MGHLFTCPQHQNDLRYVWPCWLSCPLKPTSSSFGVSITLSYFSCNFSSFAKFTFHSKVSLQNYTHISVRSLASEDANHLRKLFIPLSKRPKIHLPFCRFFKLSAFQFNSKKPKLHFTHIFRAIDTTHSSRGLSQINRPISTLLDAAVNIPFFVAFCVTRWPPPPASLGDDPIQTGERATERWRLEDSMNGTELERFEKSGERMNRVKLVPGIYLVVLLGPQNRKDKITERLDFAVVLTNLSKRGSGNIVFKVGHQLILK